MSKQVTDRYVHSVISLIKSVILGELKMLIYPKGIELSFKERNNSPYILFSPILVCIEFLGACYDELPFEQTRLERHDIVEDRFRKTIKHLFSKEYDKFNKANSKYYLYKQFRCSMIHGLRPGGNIALTTRFESLQDQTKHLIPDKEDFLILVLEDLYDDLEKASLKIIREFETGKLTNKKGDKAYLSVRVY
jgi:hypothetical protein